MTDVAAFISGSPRASRELLRAVFDTLSSLGAEAYVKTIYLGFEVNGAVMAAAYPSAQGVDVALALPEGHPSACLADATHLTWRSMPVMIELRKKETYVSAEPLLKEAFERVASGLHDTQLPTEQFMGRSRYLASRRLISSGHEGSKALDEADDDDANCDG